MRLILQKNDTLSLLRFFAMLLHCTTERFCFYAFYIFVWNCRSWKNKLPIKLKYPKYLNCAKMSQVEFKWNVIFQTDIFHMSIRFHTYEGHSKLVALTTNWLQALSTSLVVLFNSACFFTHLIQGRNSDILW